MSQVLETEMLTVGQTALLLGKSSRTIHRWIKDGKIPAYRPAQAAHYMIPRDRLMKAIGCSPAEGDQQA